MRETIAVIMTNVSGGGTVRHAEEMVNAWCRQGVRVLFVITAGRLIKISVYQDGGVIKTFQLWNDETAEELLSIFRIYEVKLLHVEHLLDAEPAFLDLHRRLGVPLVVTLHDYYTVCPFIKLTNENDEYCGEEGVASCQDCLRRRRFYSPTTRGTVSDISRWRNLWEHYLEDAAQVIVPSEDMKKRILFYFPCIHIRMIENPELLDGSERERIVGLIGVLGIAKGARKVQEVLRTVATRDAAIHFILFGTLMEVKLTEEEKKYITVLGHYDEAGIYDLIRCHPVDFFWFPGVCPETYSYTLSIPVRLHIPCISTDLGAIASRITSFGWGETYSWKSEGVAIVERLLAFDYTAYYNSAFRIRNDSFGKLEDYYGGIFSFLPKEGGEVTLLPNIQSSDVYEKIHGKLRKNEYAMLWETATFCQRVKLIRYLDWEWIWMLLHKKGWWYVLCKICEKSFTKGGIFAKICHRLMKC